MRPQADVSNRRMNIRPENRSAINTFTGHPRTGTMNRKYLGQFNFNNGNRRSEISRSDVMTAQIPEQIRYQGKTHSLFSNPLDAYFSAGGKQPPFQATCSALWRGYVGRWEITDGQLYLRTIRGDLEDGTEASLKTVFPEASGRVFAHWYTGTLRIPQGDRLKYVHGGYASVYEKDLLIDVEKGVIVRTHVQQNTVDDDDDDV